MGFGRRKKRRKQNGAVKTPFQDVRVAVATPMMDLCHSYYTTSLCNLIAYSMVEAPGMGVSFINYGTSILPFSRQLLVVKANEMECTHILWIDSDMKFPRDMLIRLLNQKKDIIGANCMSRRPPYRCTAQKEGKELITHEKSSGIERADRLGFGVLLTSMDVYRKTTMPWFEFQWVEHLSVFRGEDYSFCEKIKQAGFELWVDHDVSKEVEHIGTIGFSPLHRGTEEPRVGDVVPS